MIIAVSVICICCGHPLILIILTLLIAVSAIYLFCGHPALQIKSIEDVNLTVLGELVALHKSNAWTDKAYSALIKTAVW